MSVKRQAIGRGLFYTRDSGGKHETTPAEYVLWACRAAGELGVAFNGTPHQIESMIRNGRCADGDLFLDYGVKGNQLSRAGLDALFQTALGDPNVSHVLIPRRDRLARPDDPSDALKLENKLRENGISLVFMDKKIYGPLKRGRRRDIGEQIVGYLEYQNAGEYRRELAQKIVFAQIRLAKMGFSTGGRAPYGFRRWLAHENGALIRQLAEGERVRMPQHHVVWYPGPESEIAIIKRILDLLETMPASRVAAILTAEGVPTPDFGRQRTDRGHRHKTSGVWHQSVIGSIARNPLLLAIASYGRRSMGDQLRYSLDGPRELEDEDLRVDDKPKVVRNPQSATIRAPVASTFEPIVEPARQEKIIALLDARAGTQRGKPRSHSPERNPLGSRIFDMNCSWPMYRDPYGDKFRYKCGLYQQSHGARCAHNHVDGPTVVRFLLGCLQQRLFSPRLLSKLEERLRERAEQNLTQTPAVQIAAKEKALVDVQRDITKISKSLALAETEEERKEIRLVFAEYQGQRAALEAEVAALKTSAAGQTDPKAEVAAAMNLVRQLTVLASDPENFGAISQVFNQVNARLFLRFRKIQEGKRTLNKLASGVVIFGAAPPPIAIYEGPTGRKKLNGSLATSATEPPSHEPSAEPKPLSPGREGDSLGNVSRGDWIRTSDLLNPIQESQQPNTLSGQEVASSTSASCTSGCTSDEKTDQADPVPLLAAALLGMSPTDRARLAALLSATPPIHNEGKTE